MTLVASIDILGGVVAEVFLEKSGRMKTLFTELPAMPDHRNIESGDHTQPALPASIGAGTAPVQ